MAADLEAKTLPKHDAFVEQQLARVRGRIRALDIGRAFLGFLIWTAAYALVMAGFDLAVGGSGDAVVTAVRLGAFVVYLLGSVYFLGLAGLRLYRRINPYYAARQLEQTLPDAKNSVVNWLDLRGEKLPGAIRGALGLRAARDLKQADLDNAVSSKNTWLLAGILISLMFGLIVVFLMGPNQFGSLLTRAFAPFRDVSLATRTTIKLLQPADGDLTVPINQRVDFVVRIDGRVPRADKPDAPRLHYRYQPNDAYVGVPLEEDSNGFWTTSMHPDRVQNGFWYQITAGDDKTPEYQVQVRPLPQAQRFAVTYHYRPYVRPYLLDPEITVPFPNQKEVFPRLRAPRGTVATVVVHTKHALRDARLELDADGSKESIAGEILADDPTSFRGKFLMDKTGSFRVLFTTQLGEDNTDRTFYPVEVIPDTKPDVVLDKPGNVKLPANGILKVEGFATDDFGIKSMALKLRILEGEARPPLQAKPYRPGKTFKLDNGTYPNRLEYKDFLALDALKTTDGTLFPLVPKMVLEYWLEAMDNCDYPDAKGNRGESEKFKIEILPPEDPKKQQEQRKQAEKEQQKHDQQQDKDIDKRNEANKSDEQKQREKQKQLEDQAKKIQDELEKKKQQDEKNPGTGKGEPDKGDAKPGPKKDQEQPESKAKNQGPKADDQAGTQKEQPKADQNPGEAKNQGQQPKEQKTDQGEAKGPGKDQPNTAAKEPSPKDAAQPDKSEAKGQSKADAKGPQPQAKDAKGQEQPAAGQAKDNGKPPVPQPSAAKGEDAAKGQPKNVAKQGDPKQNQPQAQAKDAGADQKNAPQAGPKQTPPESPNDAGVAKSENPKTGEPKAKDRDITADDINNLAKKLEDPKFKDEVNKELDRLAKEAKDPKTGEALKDLQKEFGKKTDDPKFRDALENLAKKLGKGPEQVNDKGVTADDLNKLAEKLENPKFKDEIKKELDRLAKEAKDPKVSEELKDLQKDFDAKMKDPAFRDALKSLAQKLGPSGPGGKGIKEDYKGAAANVDFAKKLGSLQLEELKKLVTPDILKKAGMSAKEWQQFLQDAEAYQQSLKSPGGPAKTSPDKAGPSILPSLNPTLVGPSANPSADPLSASRPQAPPEFRPAQSIFTRPKKSP